MENMSMLMVLIVGAALLFLFIRVIRLPLKWLMKLFLHAVMGFASLFVLNFFGSWIGLYLEMTLLNALITGILGIPGEMPLLIFKYILLIIIIHFFAVYPFKGEKI